MAKKSKKLICPICGSNDFHHAIKPLKYTYKKYSIIVDQPGFWCDSCKEGILEGDDLKATREELQTFRANIDELLTPEEIYKIRKKVLKLTQGNASKILGGGVNAIGRYERGELPPPRSVSNLLRILAKHPEYLKELSPKKSA